MSSEWELDDGIKAIKSAWRREHTARRNLEKILENAEAENAKLRELVRHMHECMCNVDADGNHECYSCEYDNADDECNFERLMRDLGVEVDG